MFWTFLTIIIGATLSVVAFRAPRIGERRLFQLCGTVLFLCSAGQAAREAIPDSDPLGAIVGLLVFLFAIIWAAPFFSCILTYNITVLTRDWTGLSNIVVKPFYSAAEAAEARKP